MSPLCFLSMAGLFFIKQSAKIRHILKKHREAWMKQWKIKKQRI